MANVKFIVPDTYEAQVGVQKDGFTAKMGQLPYDNAGATVSVPADDAAHFDEKGWKRAKKGKAEDDEAKAYADMTVAELKAMLAERGIEADGKKDDLIAALEADDESK